MYQIQFENAITSIVYVNASMAVYSLLDKIYTRLYVYLYQRLNPETPNFHTLKN